jgi:aspartyl-tRNA(Asn)/glutamyl-tRNA(Gln) amidotransferase subunit B
VHVSAAWKNEIIASMPEGPAARRERFVRNLGVTEYDAGVLNATRALGDYFEAVVKSGAPAKTAANWMQTELLRSLNDAGKEISESPVTPQAFAGLLKRIESGQITAAIGKKVFLLMFETGKSSADIIAAGGLAQSVDAAQIEQACREVIEKNPENVAKYRAGNEGVFKFFVGQVMRATHGRANPQSINETLKRLLG